MLLSPFAVVSLIGRRRTGRGGVLGGFRFVGSGRGGVESFHFTRVRSLWTVYAKGEQVATEVVLKHDVRNEVSVAEGKSSVEAM